jgi:hypothetical protein
MRLSTFSLMVCAVIAYGNDLISPLLYYSMNTMVSDIFSNQVPGKYGLPRLVASPSFPPDANQSYLFLQEKKC